MRVLKSNFNIIVLAQINANDDRGVLMGRWDGRYDGGMSPTHWNGSVEVLRRWLKNGSNPVKYGQCWVFAAVMCTGRLSLSNLSSIIILDNQSIQCYLNRTTIACAQTQGCDWFLRGMARLPTTSDQRREAACQCLGCAYFS